MIKTELTARWLPVRCERGPDERSVTWIWFSPDELSEPFFAQTVAKLRWHQAPEHIGPIREVTEAAATVGNVIPAGLIFHVSRCGSTVISNVLRQYENTVVLSEAAPVLDAIGPHPELFGPNALPVQRDLLKNLISLYAYNPSGPPAKVILKLHPINLLRINEIREVWPDVPCVIVLRDPVEIMVSMLAEPAGFMSLMRTPLTTAELYGWKPAEVRAMTREQYCGKVLALYFGAARGQVDSAAIVDYATLDGGVIQAVADYFGIGHSIKQLNEIEDALRFYSKHPKKTRIFEPDSLKKQQNATIEIRAIADSLLQDHYQALRVRAVDGRPRDDQQ